MLLYKITDVKDFMKKLLSGNCFDHFLMAEAKIITGNTYQIDGHINQDFYPGEDLELLAPDPALISYWSLMKPICLSLIRGNRTPLSFRFTFQLSTQDTEQFLKSTGLSYTPADILGLVFNLRFDSTGLLCTTGTALKIFTTDKSLAHAWDKMIEKFLLKNDISFDIM